MKIVVFGSTGTIGKPLVEQALAQGHEIKAFCRDASKLEELKHASLQPFEGNVYHTKDVLDAVKGQEAVIIVLGSGMSRKSTVRSVGTKHIIEAMKKHGVRRLICQTTLGAGNSRANLNFFWKHIMFGWYLKQVYLDHELQEKYVRQSNLDWTIVRPAAFTNGEKTGKYQHGFGTSNKSLSLKISRADVAHFILGILAEKSYLHQTPALSY